MLGSLLTKKITLETLRKSIKTDNVSRESFLIFLFIRLIRFIRGQTKLFRSCLRVIFDVFGIIPDLLAVSEFC